MKKKAYENIWAATEGQADDFRTARDIAYERTKDAGLCRRLKMCEKAIAELHKYAGKKLREFVN